MLVWDAFWDPLFAVVTSVVVLVAHRRSSRGIPLSGMWKHVVLLALLATIAVELGPGGVGHTWSAASWIGKFLVMFVCAFIPLVGALAIFVSLKKARIPSALAGVTGVLLGTGFGVPVLGFVGLILVCVVTGDCV